MSGSNEPSALCAETYAWPALTGFGEILRDLPSVEEVLSRLPGMFPGQVADMLREVRGTPWEDAANTLLGRMSAGDPARLARVRRDLVLPHPLDYEWIFTADCSAELAARILACGAGSVACVGTPSVFRELAGVPGIRRLLLDRPGVVKELRKDPILLGSVYPLDHVLQSAAWPLADVAIVDSPWYPEHTIYFTGVAAACVRIGGEVLSVIPPPLTRPTAHDEIAGITTALAHLGVEVERVERDAVRYQAPPFEVETLKTLGLLGVPHDWRTGDLLHLRVLRRVDPAQVPRPVIAETWHEVRVGLSRVKFRVRDRSGDDSRLSSLVEGDVLTSVSRGNPIRKRIDVWTSGNRGYGCEAPHVLSLGVEGRTIGWDPVAYAQLRLGRELSAADQGTLAESVDRIVQAVTLEEGRIEWI